MSSKSGRRQTLVVSAPLLCAAWIALLAAPSPQTPSAYGANVPVPSEGGSRVIVSDVVMVLNDDGSAALSAIFEGQGDVVALKSVHLESAAGELDVASTQMWLPIFPGTESRAGTASDAGGFIVPDGLTAGAVVQVQFQFDNDTCLAIDAETVRRDSSHDDVFPTTGHQLGPGKRTFAMPDCSRA